jgi:DNA-binding GntR family transcriptional regulator
MVSNSGAWVSSLTQDECSEQYQIRERLEPLLLRYNLPLLTAEDLARATDLVESMKKAPDLEAFMRLDREFHWITYSRVQTTTLTDLIERLWNTTQPYRRVFMKLVRSEGGIEVTHLEHELLLEAMKRGDSEEAESILRGHIRRTRIELDRHPEVFAHQFD